MAPKSEKNMDFCYFHHFLQQRHKNGTKPSKPIDLYAHFTSDKVTLSSFCDFEISPTPPKSRVNSGSARRGSTK